ncbi:MAG: sterol desaturase family protein, partial [Ekhidna sp.]|nr:sterol desaturase family protein [Ekhidna sp.]
VLVLSTTLNAQTWEEVTKSEPNDSNTTYYGVTTAIDGVAAFVLAFVGKDFAGYWTHRFEHRINWLWNRHIIHHSSEEFNLACALRQSISEIVFYFTFLLLPLALLGVPAEVFAIVAPIHLFAQFWYHTRYIGKMGWLEKVIVTPSHHRVHHAINPEYLDKNFSQIFIFWDKLFGTFQEELDDIPCVYGVKRPVKTWNPILINFQHAWLVITDAWRTKRWKDKLRVWFMPTGWRPEDVAKKYPIKIIDDPYSQIKYMTPSSIWLRGWSYLQLFMVLFMALFLFNSLDKIPFEMSLMYAAFIFFSVYSYTTLMDLKKHAVGIELVRSVWGLGVIYYTGDWSHMSSIASWFPFVIAGYFLISLFVVAAFVRIELNSKPAKLELAKTEMA